MQTTLLNYDAVDGTTRVEVGRLIEDVPTGNEAGRRTVIELKRNSSFGRGPDTRDLDPEVLRQVLAQILATKYFAWTTRARWGEQPTLGLGRGVEVPTCEP